MPLPVCRFGRGSSSSPWPSTSIVQAIQIGAYAARLAGVRTGRIATSISLFNLFVTASRLATLVYTLMLGPLSDTAGNAIKALLPRSGPHVLSPLRAQEIAAIATTFEWQLRAIILAGTLGHHSR